ncbi:MAG: putative membrane channel-forming protein YqfA (hemolysin III family) [Paracoccaceae bacterium]|jgi:predicted membrane channel-forming protein YqfA (hemolysin III family)
MAMSYKTRRRLSLLLLLVGLPAYIATAWFIMSLFDRPPMWLELLVYIALGVIWAFPFKAVFRGIGQADPDAAPDDAP